jgi:Spy/CpxP family protein refolding chaperone
MKNFKNIFYALFISSTVSIASSAMAAEITAPSQCSDSSKTTVVSQIPSKCNFRSCQHKSWAKKLGLTDEQMTQLVSLKSEYKVNTAKQKAELKADQKKLMLLMTEEKLDKQAIFSLKEKIDSLKASISDARVNKMISVMNILTSQQRAQVRHRLLERSLSHHSRFHKGGFRSHAA